MYFCTWHIKSSSINLQVIRWWWVCQTGNSTHPAGFPLRYLPPNVRHKGECPMLPLPLQTILFTMPFRCRSMSFPYFPIFRLLLVSFGLGGSGRVLFLFASPYVRSFLVPSSDRIGRFRYGGFSKVGIRGCKVFGQNTTWACEGGDFSRQPQSGLTLQPRTIPELPLPLQRKWHLMPSWRRHGNRGIHVERRKGMNTMAQRATRIDKGRRNNKGESTAFLPPRRKSCNRYCHTCMACGRRCSSGTHWRKTGLPAITRYGNGKQAGLKAEKIYRVG